MPSTISYDIIRALDSIQLNMRNYDNVEPNAVFTWKGLDYACTPSKCIKGKLFGAGGFTPDNSLTLTARAADLPTPGPQPDQFLTYNGDRYRIDLVSTSADLASVSLICNDPNRGAGVVEREM